jgi:hypothetical protein
MIGPGPQKNRGFAKDVRQQQINVQPGFIAVQVVQGLLLQLPDRCHVSTHSSLASAAS